MAVHDRTRLTGSLTLYYRQASATAEAFLYISLYFYRVSMLYYKDVKVYFPSQALILERGREPTMEDKGIFRSSLGGFNKQDVLNYIDSITAAWNEERLALEEKVQAATDELDTLRAQAAESTEARDIALQEAEDNRMLLQDLQEASQRQEAVYRETVENMEKELAHLRHLPEQINSQKEQIAALTAANEELNGRAAAESERAATATREMMAAEERLQAKEQECLALRTEKEATAASLADTTRQLRTAEEGRRLACDAARPHIDAAYRRTDDTMTDLNAALEDLMGRLAQVQGDIISKQAALEADRQQALNTLQTTRTPVDKVTSDDTHFF